MSKRPSDTSDDVPRDVPVSSKFPVLILMPTDNEIIGWLVPFDSVPVELANILLAGRTCDWTETISEHAIIKNNQISSNLLKGSD